MSRTKSGCWTCRLRTKKKCDEATPECQRCARLGIHCFGYGPRPSEEELGDDRRALIATVGPASRRDNSRFRVWRMKPTLDLRRPAASETRTCQSHLGRGPMDNSRTVSVEDAASHHIHTTCLTALDRVNSGVIDFLHPQLLADYINQVFWLDSSFYQSPAPYHGNLWMKQFIMRSQKTHLAAALMGLTWRAWQGDLSRITNIGNTRSLTVLHSLVIQNVKDDLARAQGWRTTDELLTIGASLAKCATMLLTFEVWRTLEGAWMTHLGGMSDILIWLVSLAPAEMDTAMKTKPRAQAVDNEFGVMKVAPDPDKAITYLALKWFVQCYTWNDISASVWAGPHYTHSRCNRFYSPLLEGGHLQIDRFMGCEDWVLYAMSKISMIEERSLMTPSRHDLEDMVREAEDWHQKLNTRLACILKLRYDYPPGPDRDSTFVTEIWIHAALVYLHVVTTGSHLNHPRLRLYVARGLYAYQNLPRRHDIHTAMPFGVLASMADEEEAQEFLRLAGIPRNQTEINPGQRKVFNITKECWRLRKLVEESPAESGVTWRDGASSLGLTLLPI